MSKKRRMILMAGLVMSMSTVGAVSAITLTGCSTPAPVADVTGVYYAEVDGKDCVIKLNGSDFTYEMTLGDVSAIGEYTYDGTNLNLTSSDNQTLVASLNSTEGVITLTYGGKNYSLSLSQQSSVKVSFVDGTQTLNFVTTLSGKKVDEPVAPDKSGYAFIGWYETSNFGKLFDFEAKTITADTTVYARYVQIDSDKQVYNVNFDAGEGVEAPAAMKTVNGVIYELPTVSKSGAVFAGWWVSNYDDASKLTYQYEGQELQDDTTLYAVWKGEGPLVSVSATGIKWSADGNNNRCQIVITSPDGEQIGPFNNTSGWYDYDFDNAAPGDYTVSVTLNEKTTTVYYRNKISVLAKASGFTFEGNVFKFNPVPNAERYLLTIECGNAEHSHTDIDLGTATQYDFSECDMTPEGIKFTVKAEAEGYLGSTSQADPLIRNLDKVTGLAVDNETDHISWNAVENATGYVVEITPVGGQTQTFNVANAADGYSVSSFGDEALTIKVYPVAHGYNSSEPATIEYAKTRLSSPANLAVEGDVISWSAVNKAQGYVVKIGSVEHTVDGTSYTLTSDDFTSGTAVIKVMALGANSAQNSFDSSAYTVDWDTLNANPVYEGGMLKWNPVLRAESFEVKVNDGEPVSVAGDKISCAVTFTAKGDNVVYIRSVAEGGATSEWKSVNVTAYSVKLNANNGSDVVELFKAYGDEVSLTDATKTGYTFNGWYDAAENGKKFERKTYDATDLTLYAYYTANEYTVTLAMDDGGTLEGETSFVLTFGDDFNLPVPTSNKGEKIFGGWRLEPNGAGLQYTDPEGTSMRTWNIAENKTLYVSWINVFEFKLSQNGKEYALSAGPGIKYASNVTIPATYGEEALPVRTIESGAFKDCTKLISVNIPTSVTTIAEGESGIDSMGSAFQGCSSLEAINIYEVEGTSMLASKYISSDGVLIKRNDLNSRVEVVACPKAKVGTVTIADEVTSIASYAFKGANISRVEIPASVMYIQKEAFYSNSNLTEVIFLPATDNETAAPLNVSERAFASCKALTSIEFPSRLSDFNVGAFEYCSSLTAVNVQAADNAIFTSVDGVVIKDVTQGDNVVKTLYYYPRGREGAYTIPSTAITAIGEKAFADCENLTEIVIPEWITYIGNEAFYSCGSLTSVVFEGDVDSLDLTIDEKAFYYCSGLTEVVLPANLTTLNKNAFGGISGLTKVTINCNRTEDKMSYDMAAFSSTSGTTYVTDLTLGASVAVFDINGVFGSAALQNVIVHEDNKNYSDVDGVLYDKNVTKVVYYPNGKSGDYVLPETVTEIGARVFENKLNITNITITANVKTIGERAFYGCSNLVKITFVDGAVELNIGNEAFSGCKNLEELTLPTRLREIGDKSFLGCKTITELILPEGLVKVGHRAFSGMTMLTKFHISSTVTELAVIPKDDTTPNNGVSYGSNQKPADEWYYNTSKTCPVVNANTDIFLDTSSGIVSPFQLTGFTVAEGNAKYASYEGILCAKDEEGKLVSVMLAPPRLATDGVVTIPGTITTICDRAFYSNYNITEIKFEDSEGELSFGSNVFESGISSALAKVTLPAGLKTISASLFKGCEDLTEIVIPNTVTEIGTNAFKGCKSLAKVIFAEGGTEDLVFGEGDYVNTNPSGQPYYSASGAFADCNNIKELVLPERVKTISKYAFNHLTGLEKIVIPASVTKIDENAFDSCSKLATVVFTDNEGSSMLSEIALKAFKDCTSLADMTLPSNLKTIGNYAFEKAALTSVAIPANVTTIGNYAFDSMPNLTTVTFAANSVLTSIGENAFYADKNLSSVNLEACTVLESIGKNAFMNDASLASVKLPASVKTIGDQAFIGCANLTEVTFLTKEVTVEDKDAEGVVTGSHTEQQSDLTSIGKQCFSKTALTQIAFPKSTSGDIALGTYMFEGCESLTTVELSPSIASITNVFAKCYTLTKIIINDSENFATDPNAPLILAVNGTSIKLAYGAIPTEAGTYRIPEGIVEIEASAFKNQNGIKKLILPASLQVIGDYAFQNCRALETVELAEGSQLTNFGKYAFANCISLKDVDFGTATTISEYAFHGCISLESITLPENVGIGRYAFSHSGLTSVTIPATLKFDESDTSNKLNAYQAFGYCYSLTSVTLSEGLTWIGEYMFAYDSAIKSITIPSSVTLIKNYAFRDCTSLTSAVLNYNINTIAASSSATSGIGTYTFSGCTALESVTFGETAAATGNYMFNGCTALKAVDASSVSLFGTYVFQKCSALETVVLYDGLTALGNYMFQGCESLTTVKCFDGATVTGEDGKVTLPSTLTNIGAYTFENSGITSVTIPTGVTKFGGTSTSLTASTSSNLFSGCVNLTEVILHDKLTAIGANAFKNCANLTSVKYMNSAGVVIGEEGVITLPSSLTTLGNNAFGTGRTTTAKIDETKHFVNTKITKVYVPKSITTLGTYVFQDCVALETAEYYVTKSANGMFSGCTSLSLVKLNGAATTVIGNYMFEYCSALKTIQCDTLDASGNVTATTGDLNKITLPSKMSAMGTYAFRYSGIEEVTIPTTLKNLGTAVGTSNYAFYNCQSLRVVNLHSAFTTIGAYVFVGCTALEEVNNAGAVTLIGNYAFDGCEKLTTIDTAKLATTGNYTFRNCSALETVDLSKLKTIGTNSFQYCTSLTTANLAAVTSLGNNAFDGCSSLSSLKLNNALTRMGNYAFRDCSALTVVTLPTSLATTGTYTFQNTGITSITIPASVATVDQYMFAGCQDLASVTFSGEAIKTIGNYAFNNCKSLTSITIPETVTTIGSSAFSSSGLTSIVIPASVTSIGGSCFLNCNQMTSITIPSNFVGFGTNVFAGCYKLNTISVNGGAHSEFVISQDDGMSICDSNGTLVFYPAGMTGNVVIPEGVTSIGSYVFNGCKADSITLPSTVTSLDAYAFYGYHGAVNLSNATSLTQIASKAFQNYGGTSIVIPEGVTTLGWYAFYSCDNLESVSLPSTLKTIESQCFRDCVALKSIEIPDSVENMAASYTFAGCASLESVKLPSNLVEFVDYVDGELKSAGTYTFSGCSALTSIVLPSTLTVAPNYMFSALTSQNYDACSGIKSLTLPVALTSASAASFTGLTALEELILPEGLTYIPSFSKIATLTSVSIPSTVTTVYASAFSGCTGLASVTIAEGATTIAGSMFKDCALITEVKLPSTITSIGASAFSGTAITEVALYEGLTDIGASAFAGTGITSVTIPSTVTTMGNSVFNGCEKLASVKFAEGTEAMTWGTNMFSGTAIETITVPANLAFLNNYAFQGCLMLKTVVISEGVTKIGSYAFEGCTALTSVTLPESLTYIDSAAFDNCTSIKTITIQANVDTVFMPFKGWTSEQTIVIKCYAFDSAEWNNYWTRQCGANIVVECLNPVYVKTEEETE